MINNKATEKSYPKFDPRMDKLIKDFSEHLNVNEAVYRVATNISQSMKIHGPAYYWDQTLPNNLITVAQIHELQDYFLDLYSKNRIDLMSNLFKMIPSYNYEGEEFVYGKSVFERTAYELTHVFYINPFILYNVSSRVIFNLMKQFRVIMDSYETLLNMCALTKTPYEPFFQTIDMDLSSKGSFKVAPITINHKHADLMFSTLKSNEVVLTTMMANYQRYLVTNNARVVRQLLKDRSTSIDQKTE